MEKISEYNIVASEHVITLASAVNAHIKAGWQPHGTVFIEDLSKPGSHVIPSRKYCQPMVKYLK